MTDDRDITERLEDTRYDGAIYMRIEAAKEIRALREYSSKQALDIVTLGQEVGRLREALRPFAEYASQEGFDLDCNGIPMPDEEGVGWVYLSLGHFRAARAALAEHGEK